MRKAFSLGLAVATATSGLALFAAGPASAAPCGSAGDVCSADTVLTVNLSGGTMSISAPSTASMSGSVAVGTVIGPTNMGSSATQVTDNRGTVEGWTVTAATSGDLSSTSAGTSITLSATGPLVLTTGTVSASGTSLLTGVSSGAGGALNATTPVTVATALLGAGGGTYTYTPTLTLTVPPNTTAAPDYTTTITQSLQ